MDSEPPRPYAPLQHAERLVRRELVAAEAACIASHQAAEGERERAERYRGELEADLFTLGLQLGTVKLPEPIEPRELGRLRAEDVQYPFQREGDVEWPPEPRVPLLARHVGNFRHVAPPWPALSLHQVRCVAVAELVDRTPTSVMTHAELAEAVNAYLVRSVSGPEVSGGYYRPGDLQAALRSSLEQVLVEGVPVWEGTSRGATEAERAAALQETKRRAVEWRNRNWWWLSGAARWARER